MWQLIKYFISSCWSREKVKLTPQPTLYFKSIFNQNSSLWLKKQTSIKWLMILCLKKFKYCTLQFIFYHYITVILLFYQFNLATCQARYHRINKHLMVLLGQFDLFSRIICFIYHAHFTSSIKKIYTVFKSNMMLL